MQEKLKTHQPSGRLYLIVAVLLLGSASAVTRKLTDIGAENLIHGHNPISFCNVLFIGNLCALAMFTAIYQHQWRWRLLKHIRWKQWLILTIVAVLSSAVIPALIFKSLTLTTVNNVILIGQLDVPLALALSVIFLGDRINKWIICGAMLSFVGVALTVFLSHPSDEMASGMGFEIGLGDLLILLAAVCKAISNTISKVSLRQIPLGIFNIYRMMLGTAVFFVITVSVFDLSHFMDVTSPFIWRWMLFYGAIIVVGGQLTWFKGLALSTASEVSLAAAFNPLAGILAAALILGELPTQAQYIGGVVILIGVMLNQIGIQRLNMAVPDMKPTLKTLGEGHIQVFGEILQRIN